MPAHLYLHGFGSGPSSFKANWFRERFDARGRVLELPRLVPGAFREQTLTSQLEALHQAVGGRDEVVLLGSSLGGLVGALYASINPNTVIKLILFAPAFGFPERWVRRLGPSALEAWKESGEHRVYHWEAGREEGLGYGIVEDAARYPRHPDVRCPTLVLHGHRDETVPLEYGQAFADACPGARLVAYDSDHGLADVLEPMWAEIQGFLWGDEAADDGQKTVIRNP